MTGHDGIGECLCDRGRPFTSRFLAYGRKCWACQRRDNRHGPIDPVVMLRRDEANAYDPLDEDGGSSWLPLHEDGSERRASRRACDGDTGPTMLDIVQRLPIVVGQVKTRPTLNPTARDLHHLRTGDVWNPRLSADGWIDESARRGWAPQHGWGDENIRAMTSNPQPQRSTE